MGRHDGHGARDTSMTREEEALFQTMLLFWCSASEFGSFPVLCENTSFIRVLKYLDSHNVSEQLLYFSK